MTASTFVSARDGEKNSVIYTSADGTEELHSGGSRAWRNNNPGNLVASERSGLAIGQGGKFAVFPNHETGLNALKHVLEHGYAALKLDQVFAKYAPPGDNNDPARYSAQVKTWTGLDSSRLLGNLNGEELTKFMSAIERAEGWIVGKIDKIPHARQFVIRGVDDKPISNVSYHINFLRKNGFADKVSGTTDQDGKTAVVKTDVQSQVSLTLPQPDPGHPFKAGAGKKPLAAPKVIAADVKTKPWYAWVFAAAEESKDPKDAPRVGPAMFAAPAATAAVAPVTVVRQCGATKASGTRNKSEKYVEPVVKEEGVNVTWLFDTTKGSGKVLKDLPYIVVKIEGGLAKPLFEGEKVQLMQGNRISAKVPFGADVGLFLGNDSKEIYRKTRLYTVNAEKDFSDIVVKIQEKSGTNYIESEEIPNTPAIVKKTKTYKASLYGTTWMKFSHKFTEVEASTMTNLASADVQNAIKKIYNGTAVVNKSMIQLSVTKPNKKTLKITWNASAFSNCKQNIPLIRDLDQALSEVIPRVNPHTYEAFLTASFQIDADELIIASGWRPMLGSCAHRIGIGLDVDAVVVEGKTIAFGRGLTAEEKAYQQAVTERIKLENLALKKTITPDETIKLTSLLADEPKKLARSAGAVTRSQLTILKLFTQKLRDSSEVRQTFDPWEMDMNTKDKNAPTQNNLSDANEKLHATHLHITVIDRELSND